jgi:uncharacterized transporter YbjL
MKYALTIKQKQLLVKTLKILETIERKYGNKYILDFQNFDYSVGYLISICDVVINESVYSETQRCLLNELRNIYIQYKMVNYIANTK